MTDRRDRNTGQIAPANLVGYAPPRMGSRVVRRQSIVHAATLATGVLLALLAPRGAHAIGARTQLDWRTLLYDGGNAQPRPSAPRRIAWELRKRTNIEPRLDPTAARADDPSIFATPFLYWAGDRAFPPLSEAEVVALRRFVLLGGTILVDDARPATRGPSGAPPAPATADDGAFTRSVRRDLARILPSSSVETLPPEHVLHRAYYLLDRPVGRVMGPATLETVSHDGRAAVILSSHDLGGAWARDGFGNWEHEVEPGGDTQRETAIRLGVNLAMYVLCQDYKDDQVHAPFIMRRRGARTRRLP
ncbi:MAG: DUF4159 domain-containing protein [Deltaproteobacteria bacterium]|nr:DUF4159 domain-containing protein [Deltaproteobacteria bacterium]